MSGAPNAVKELITRVESYINRMKNTPSNSINHLQNSKLKSLSLMTSSKSLRWNITNHMLVRVLLLLGLLQVLASQLCTHSCFGRNNYIWYSIYRDCYRNAKWCSGN